jgi:hypothetical protein
LKPIAVFPSNREVDGSILDALPGIDIAIVEASGFSRPVRDDPRVHILSLEQQSNDFFGDDSDLLGYGSAALRNYGVWWAYHNGYDLVINLDDDCWPEEGFVERYLSILVDGEEASLLTSNTGWVSTLHRESPDEPWYPRGFPYEERLNGHRQRTYSREIVRPVVHMGLWDGTPDLNAVDKYSYGSLLPLALSRGLYATASMYLPVCAMNFACLRDWAPFIYQIPWTQFGPTMPLHRYDDIIGGLMAAAIARLEHAYISFGPPFVDHRKKDNDLMVHAVAENFGNVLVSRLAYLLDRAVDSTLRRELPTRMERTLALLDTLQERGSYYEFPAVTNYIADTFRRWLGYFR